MKTVSDNALFITLVSAAENDAVFAQRILAIARLSEVERKLKILQLVKDCRHNQAPEEFIDALTYLGDDKIARQLCEILST